MRVVAGEYNRIVALRNEKGSYSQPRQRIRQLGIVALRNEKGSYSESGVLWNNRYIVALRNEKGSYSCLRQ